MSSVTLADEIVHLDGGRVVDRGTHDELLARDPGYRELATAYERESGAGGPTRREDRRRGGRPASEDGEPGDQ